MTSSIRVSAMKPIRIASAIGALCLGLMSGLMFGGGTYGLAMLFSAAGCAVIVALLFLGAGAAMMVAVCMAAASK